MKIKLKFNSFIFHLFLYFVSFIYFHVVLIIAIAMNVDMREQKYQLFIYYYFTNSFSAFFLLIRCIFYALCIYI